jgi:SAF domain
VMATVVRRPRAGSGERGPRARVGDPMGSVGVPRRERRRPALLAAGVALAVASGLAVVSLVQHAGHRQAVLVTTQAIPIGTVVTAGDLGVAQVAADAGVATVAASQRAVLVGQVAATTLPAGEVLAPGQIAASAAPPAGQQWAVLPLQPGRMPALGLHAGDSILVVSTPTPGTGATGTANSSLPTTIAASVVRVGTGDANGVVPVDVQVADVDGPVLAAEAATGQIAVVIAPRTVG